MDNKDVRKEFLEKLNSSLIGPSSLEEDLDENPRVKYLYGFLNPSTGFDEDSSLENEVADNSNLSENTSQEEREEIEKEVTCEPARKSTFSGRRNKDVWRGCPRPVAMSDRVHRCRRQRGQAPQRPRGYRAHSDWKTRKSHASKEAQR